MMMTGPPSTCSPDTSPKASPGQAVVGVPAKVPSKSKPRKRVNTAEKRHQHNAIERQRRETLNGKFLSLARLLPSLATHRRPSKSAIVNGSIAHLTHQRNQRLLASRLLRQLCAERDALAKECNEWRFANGVAPRDASSAWTDEMDEVCNVEKETFGTFATMDDGDDDGDDNQGPGEMSLEQAAAVAAHSFGPHGLITPRSSLDTGNAHGMQQHMQQQPTIVGWPQAVSQQPTFSAPNMSASTTTSLPFNAFMTEDSVSPANSGFSGHMPTTPAFASQLQQTPSPRSSTSDEASLGKHQQQARSQQPSAQGQPWTEQQLLFLRAIHQQRQSQSQNGAANASLNINAAQQQQQQFNPLAFANSTATATAYALPSRSNSGSESDTSAFQFLSSVFPLQQQQQQQQGMLNMPLASPGNMQSSAALNGLSHPTLNRSQSASATSQASMLHAFRNGMGMSWDQQTGVGSGAVNGIAVEGF